jgi:hypothetical protein
MIEDIDLGVLEEWARRDYWRAVMYADLKPRLASVNPSGVGVEYGGSNGEIQSYCPGVSWDTRGYPEYDILDARSWDREWDVVILDQILEHVERPWEVFDYLASCTRQVAIIAVPFLIGVHPCPDDCWRLTPSTIRRLSEGRFRKVVVNSWGHTLANYWHSAYDRTEIMMGRVPEIEWRGALLMNDDAKPFHIWAVLEK